MAKSKWYEKEWSDAEQRIQARINLGLRPNINDQLILGTRFDELEIWFENAYKDIKVFK